MGREGFGDNRHAQRQDHRCPDGLYNPENDRHSYLVDHAKEAGADGILFWYLKFCEPDAFDRPQLMKRLAREGIPSTVVELELSMKSFDAVRTRINAFCEMLEG